MKNRTRTRYKLFGIVLFLCFLSFSLNGQDVLINEVVTDPQQDWSTNNFDGTDGGGAINENDDWVELYIVTGGIDLTGWTIELNDGSDVSGSLAAGGAFSISNYVGSGTFNNTDADDYLVLGNITSGAINLSGLTVVLRDDSNTIVDEVTIDATSGTMFTGNASGSEDESVCRIPNGTDTDVDADDFVQSRATPGASNSPSGTVLINEVITDPQQDWSSVGFSTQTAGGVAGTNDEWIELYIGTSGLNLTKWEITFDDGTPVSGDLADGGAFDESVYFGTGSFVNTQVGDYLVLGNPTGSEVFNNSISLTLRDAEGTTIDVVEIGNGAGETGFTGNADDTDDESVCRIPDGTDTNVEADDFVQTRATLGASNSPGGTVVINEVVTDPQQDWSTNDFDGTDGGGTTSDVDEWIELYIGTSGLNLTKWSIEMIDGTDESKDLTEAFSVLNYIGSGSFINTQAGDYLILGNPDGDITNDVYIALYDASGVLVDDVEIGDDDEGDGSGDGAPDGSVSGGNASGIADEAIFRVPEGEDTDDDVADFAQGLASLGMENGVIYVDASAADDTGFGRPSDPKQFIQSGIDIAPARGRVEVAAGTYSETLSISRPLTIYGANQGVPADGSRGAESIVDPSSSNTGILISSDSVTIDGLQLGTDNTTSNITTGISSTGNQAITLENNIVYANSVGVLIEDASSGALQFTDNHIEMLNLEDPLNPGNASIGIVIQSITGTANADLTANDLTGASYGIFGFELTASPVVTIADGNYSGCTKGIEINNTDGSNFAASNINISGVVMDGFTGPDPDLTQPDTQAGIYAFVTGNATATDDIVIDMTNVDISGTSNGDTDYAAVYIADFQASGPFDGTTDDGIGITATLSDSDIHDNQNRGIYSRGRNATTTVTQTTITGNGFNPFSSGAGGVVLAYGILDIENSILQNPASGTVDGVLAQNNGTITVVNSSIDRNGNGDLANTQSGGTVNISSNWLGETDQSTIESYVDVTTVDFTPWLASGTDADGSTAGFQPDLSALYVGTGGTQTGGSDRLQEAHDLVDADGTLTVTQANYAETLTISKPLTLIPETNTSIDDVELNGGNLTLNDDLTIDNTLTLTSGVVDLDPDDGDRSDDPVLSLSNAVAGTFGPGSHIEGIVEVEITAATSFDFPVGDEGSYRPATLAPTNTATFTVSHISAATPVGGGTNGDFGDLVGDISSEVGSGDPIESVLNTRYWNIDIASGTPGDTDVTLQITGADDASDPTTLGMARFDGTDWLEVNLSGTAGSDPFTITGSTNTFSSFSVYSTDALGNPLPVELVYFEGRKMDGQTVLQWQTASEKNNDRFEVQHSIDGNQFDVIGAVEGQGTTENTTNYDFVHAQPGQQVNYYRLKQIDHDGQFAFSEIVIVSFDDLAASVKVYPNPATDAIVLQTKGMTGSTVLITNLAGMKVMEQQFTDLPGKQTLDISTLPSGTYVLQLSGGKQAGYSTMFVKE